MIHCKICNSQTRTIHDKQFDVDYYLCSKCDFLFIDSQGHPSKDKELNLYLQHENSLENEGYVNMFKNFIDNAVVPFCNSGNALDFGSGPGPVLSHLLTEKGFDTDIYDPFFSPQKVYEGKTYDLITSTEVFEHLQNPLDIFHTLYNCLNPDGIISIMTLYHPQNDEIFQDWWYRRDITHISFFTHQTFKYLAQKFNMKVLHLDAKNICVLQK